MVLIHFWSAHVLELSFNPEFLAPICLTGSRVDPETVKCVVKFLEETGTPSVGVNFSFNMTSWLHTNRYYCKVAPVQWVSCQMVGYPPLSAYWPVLCLTPALFWPGPDRFGGRRAPTSPNCPSPSFSFSRSCCLGNSATEMSFLVKESTVMAGTAYVLLPVTPCRLTISVSA